MSSLIMPRSGIVPPNSSNNDSGDPPPTPARPSFFTDEEFQQLYTVLKYSACRQRININDASELAQATLYQVLVLIDRLGGSLHFESQSKLHAWVREIFKHILLKYFDGRNKRKTVEPTSDLVQPGESPSKVFTAQTIKELVDAMLAKLDPRDEQIVRWRMFDKQSYQHIGDQLGVSDVHARTLYHKALDQLRAWFANTDPSAYF